VRASLRCRSIAAPNLLDRPLPFFKQTWDLHDEPRGVRAPGDNTREAIFSNLARNKNSHICIAE
jgi:hypothetical protein